MGLELRTVADDLMTRDPDRIALIDQAGELTYRDYRAAVLAATARLRDAGVKPNDRLVIIDSPNRLPLIADGTHRYRDWLGSGHGRCHD